MHLKSVRFHPDLYPTRKHYPFNLGIFQQTTGLALTSPVTAAINWPETCKDDPNVAYVFGEADVEGASVPYATKSHFEAHGTYNLTMRLGVHQTDKGPRHYIVSGN